MDNEKPSYYAIIPANVRYDTKLSANAKLLYAEITSLCGSDGKCFASNEYFSKLYDVSKKSIINWINELVDNGFLEREIVYKDNSKEVQSRFLFLPIVNDTLVKKFSLPSEKKFTDNNIYINNINNISNINNNINNKDIYIYNRVS